MKTAKENFRHRDNLERGFIALMAVLIISVTLLTISFTGSNNGFFSRFGTLESEYKRIGLGLSEACVNVALLRVAQNPDYQPASGGDVVSVGGDECLIKHPITYDKTNWATSPYQEVATIKTQAEYQGTWSNMNISATVQNPNFALVVRGTITVVTHVINNDGGSNQAGDFNITVSPGALNPTPSTFSGSETGTVVYINPGSYNITSTNLAGYNQSASADCSGSIAAGANKVCTITHNDIPTTATLTLVAEVTNDNGGTKQPSDFSLFLDGNPASSGIPVNGLSTGTHTATKNNMAGYSASSWGHHCASNGSVNLNAGDNKTCIIKFDDDAPPAPSCADTLVMLDRTGSMTASDLANQKAAADALLNLYKTVTPNPNVGIGSFGGLDGTNASVPFSGQLTNNYNNVSTSTGSMSPVVTTAPNQWVNPGNAFSDDNSYATESSPNEQQGYKFNLGVPFISSIEGIEATLGAKASAASSVTTPILFPNGQGFYTDWVNGESTVDETLATDCTSGDSIIESTVNDRESVLINLGSIPNGSTITNVSVTVYDRGDSAGGGTYKTFARLNSLDTDAIANLTATGTGSCTPKNQIIDVPDTVKSGSTILEVGVVKTAGNNNAVRIGAMRVTVTYVPTARVGVNLSWNNGANWTSQKVISLTSSETAQTVGSSSDTWGRTWSVNDLSNSNFVLRLTNNVSGFTVSVDYIKLKVHYTTGLYKTIEFISNSTTSGTNLAAAINAGNTELNSGRHDPSKEKVLVLISDGMVSAPSNSPEGPLDAADSAKLSGTKIFTIHFGGDPAGFLGQELLASLASGTAPVPSHSNHAGGAHQTGSADDQSSAAAENTDGDQFFISPAASDMTNIFQTIGKIVCPALSVTPTPPPTTGNIIIITNVVNDNGGVANADDFTSLLSAQNPVPSGTPPGSFTGVAAPGKNIAVDPGNYDVDQSPLSGYTKNLGVGCSGTISAGTTKTCTITNDDIQATSVTPIIPPPLTNITIGSWAESP